MFRSRQTRKLDLVAHPRRCSVAERRIVAVAGLVAFVENALGRQRIQGAVKKRHPQISAALRKLSRIVGAVIVIPELSRIHPRKEHLRRGKLRIHGGKKLPAAPPRQFCGLGVGAVALAQVELAALPVVFVVHRKPDHPAVAGDGGGDLHFVGVRFPRGIVIPPVAIARTTQRGDERMGKLRHPRKLLERGFIGRERLARPGLILGDPV